MRHDVGVPYEVDRDVIHDRYLPGPGSVDVEQALRDTADLLRGGAPGVGPAARAELVAQGISNVAEGLLAVLESLR